MSDDVNFVVLESRATNFGGPAVATSIYLRDRAAGVTRIVSVATDGTDGNAPSREPWLTPDARQIAFESNSSTFVPETSDFLADDVFVRDIR